MANRTRNQQNKDKRNTTIPESGAVADHALDDHTDTNLGTPADGDIIYWDAGTSRYVTGTISDFSNYLAAHGETDAVSTLVAAANNTWQDVPFDTSIITDVAVCPLSFFTAGGAAFTPPEDGYYFLGFNLAHASDPDLFSATLDFGLFKNGTLYRTFPVSSNDWSINHCEVPDEITAGDVFKLRFRRSGAGYATAVDISARANFVMHKIAAVAVGSAPHALNSHTDTNFPSPTDGQVITWDSTPGEWVAATPTLIAHTFGQHSNANANLTSPGAGLDQYVVVWDQASTSFKLVINSAVAAPHALDDHSDTNLGSPGAPEDGYVVSWDNGTSSYVLVAPTSPGAHTLDSHSDVNVPTPVAGDLLSWDSGTSQWVNVTRASVLAGHNHTFDSLSDVNMTGKVDGSVPVWDTTTSRYIPDLLSLDDLSDVTISAPTTGQGLIWNGSSWVNGTVAATVTAAWGYFYSNSSGFLAGSGSGTSLNSGVSPNRFTVSTAGVWLFQVHCSGSSTPGDLSISTSVGGTTPGTTYSNTCLASLPAGGYFTITGPSPVGNTYSITLTKVGT